MNNDPILPEFGVVRIFFGYVCSLLFGVLWYVTFIIVLCHVQSNKDYESYSILKLLSHRS